MLKVEHLATLLAIVEQGSFSAAARALRLTQPAVSRQVALLERQAGIPLLRRTARGVQPTEAGRVLLVHTEAIIDRMSRAESDLAELAGLRTGTIRLGSFLTAVVHLSGELGALLAEQHPGLVIADRLVDHFTALDLLDRGELDIALVFEHDFEPPATSSSGDVDVQPLFADPVRVLLPTGHPLANRRTIHLSDLAGETWIRAHDGSAARLIDHILQAAGIAPDLLLAGHGDEPVELQALVVAGKGITIAHKLNVIISSHRLASRPLADYSGVRHVQVASLPGPHSPTVTAALTALRTIGQRRRGGNGRGYHNADSPPAGRTL